MMTMIVRSLKGDNAAVAGGVVSACCSFCIPLTLSKSTGLNVQTSVWLQGFGTGDLHLPNIETLHA